METTKNNIRKCTQCGASLPLNRDMCEYCGSVYKSNKPEEKAQIGKPNKKGDIISDFEDLLDGIFDFPFMDD